MCHASPSKQLYRRNSDLFDEWGVCRTRAYEDDGFFQASRTNFRPVIALESLGSEAEKAYELGTKYASTYPDERQLAEAIFAFVRDSIKYTSDIDQFGYREFAQNADELIRTIEKESIVMGDCEDYAILLAVMWKGAGLRSAVVLARDHAAALVHLPGYRMGNVVWEPNDEKGWIWGEATGSDNPLGWTPDQYLGADLLAYEVTDRDSETPELAQRPPGTATDMAKGKGGNPIWQISPFFSMIFFLWIISAAARALRGVG